jgi:hypothetical protein
MDDIEHRDVETDSESSGTNIESNGDVVNNTFGEEDIDVKQTVADNAEVTDNVERDINSNHEYTDDKQSRPNLPRRKISRLTSAI